MNDIINGHKVVATFTTSSGLGLRAGRLILVDRGDNSDMRWVSSWQGQGDDEWSQGHYFADFVEARDHFLAACGKRSRL
jgi:hypothetical protein